MRQQRRLGAENSETRTKLIDAAAHIVRIEGAGAVTAGRLAELVGLQRHAVHYYFGTIEELLLAVLRRDGERTREWMARALETEDPLQIIWQLASRAASSVLEFSALATRHEPIREEFRRISHEVRRALSGALERYIDAEGLAPTVPSAAVTVTLQSIAYTLAIERLLGIDEGHCVTKESLRAMLGLTPHV